jgi:hypothetical protein
MTRRSRRYSCLSFAALFIIVGNLRAQSLGDLARLADSPLEKYRGIALGGGMTWIDGKPYYLAHVAPQLQFDKWGIGIDGNLRIGTDGKFRHEDFDETYDYLRWINYVSYGDSHDDIYARIGGLKHASIGHGVIVSDYSNNSSYDDRKIGLSTRINLGPFGGEVLTSDLFRRGLIALRPFVFPFQLTPLHGLPILKDIEVGATGVFDFDTNATRIIPNHLPYAKHLKSLSDSTVDSVVILGDSVRFATPFTTFGFDISSILWRSEKAEGKLYGDYVNFQHFNDGVIVGLRTSFLLSDDLFLDLRGERSLFKNHFLPNYYNGFYERDRYDDEARPQDYITKMTLLSDSSGGNGNGFRAGAFVRYGTMFEIQSSYSHLDNLPGKDWIEIIGAIPQLMTDLFIDATYARKNITDVGDIFAIDERSLMTARASYRVLDWVIASAISRWTFSKDDQGHVKSQYMIEPKVDVIFKL